MLLIKSKPTSKVSNQHFLQSILPFEFDEIKVCQQGKKFVDLGGQFFYRFLAHMGQNLEQINIPKYVSKFLINGGKTFDKHVKSQKRIFVHGLFLQS